MIVEKKYQEYLQNILTLVKSGKDILSIEIGNETVFFLVEEFSPPVGGSVSALPYFSFSGTCICDFLKNSVYNEQNKAIAISNFEAKHFDKNFSYYQFSEQHSWRYYSSSK